MSKFEPEANALIENCNVINHNGGELDLSVTDTASLLSIAISLKRIADEVCGVPYDPAPGADNSKHRMSLTEGIQNAIEQGAVAIIHSAR